MNTGLYSGFGQAAGRKKGQTLKLLIGAFLVLLTGFVGIVFAAPMHVLSFWPFAAIWAAIGWGGSRASIRTLLLLVGLGLVQDLTQGAPIGCWVAINLVTYLVSLAFRKRAATDSSGFFRMLGDVTAFVVSFLFAQWLIGSYLDGMSASVIVKGFFTTGLLYLPVRPLFLLSKQERVD